MAGKRSSGYSYNFKSGKVEKKSKPKPKPKKHERSGASKKEDRKNYTKPSSSSKPSSSGGSTGSTSGGRAPQSTRGRTSGGTQQHKTVRKTSSQQSTRTTRSGAIGGSFGGTSAHRGGGTGAIGSTRSRGDERREGAKRAQDYRRIEQKENDPRRRTAAALSRGAVTPRTVEDEKKAKERDKKNRQAWEERQRQRAGLKLNANGAPVKTHTTKVDDKETVTTRKVDPRTMFKGGRIKETVEKKTYRPNYTDPLDSPWSIQANLEEAFAKERAREEAKKNAKNLKDAKKYAEEQGYVIPKGQKFMWTNPDAKGPERNDLVVVEDKDAKKLTNSKKLEKQYVEQVKNDRIKRRAEQYAKGYMAHNGEIKSEELTMEDYYKLQNALRLGPQYGNKALGDDLARKVGSAMAYNANKNKKAQFVHNFLQGSSPANIENTIGKYGTLERQALKEAKESKAGQAGYMAGFMAQFIGSGAGTIGQNVLGKGIAKGTESGLKRFMANRLGETIAEAPINALDAAKMATDENGKINKKALAMYLGLNTGMTIVGGAAMEGVGAGLTKRAASELSSTKARIESGHAGQEDYKKFFKTVEKFRGYADNGDLVQSGIAENALKNVGMERMSKKDLTRLAELQKKAENGVKMSDAETGELHTLEETAKGITARNAETKVKLQNAVKVKTEALNKLKGDTGIEYVVKSNDEIIQDLRALGQDVPDDKRVDGVTVPMPDGTKRVYIDGDYEGAMYTVLGHEFTHTLSGSKHFDGLKNAVKEFASGRNVDLGDGISASEYDLIRGQFASTYESRLKGKSKEEAERFLDEEVTAELVGRYIFSDDGETFIRSLSAKDPNALQRIYEYIKRAIVNASNDTEKKQLYAIRDQIQKAYRDTAKQEVDNGAKFRLDDDKHAPIFYSEMEEAAKKLGKDRRIGADSQDIHRFFKKHGVKDEELKWVGIDEWLEKRREAGMKSVTTPELVDFIRSNNLELEVKTRASEGEHSLGDFGTSGVDEVYSIQSRLTEDLDLTDEWYMDASYDIGDTGWKVYVEVDMDRTPFAYNAALYDRSGREIEEIAYWDDLDNFDDALLNSFDRNWEDIAGSQGDTEWGAYTLSGGENYREYEYIMPSERLAEDYTNQAMRTHWGDENVVAHARIQDFHAHSFESGRKQAIDRATGGDVDYAARRIEENVKREEGTGNFVYNEYPLGKDGEFTVEVEAKRFEDFYGGYEGYELSVNRYSDDAPDGVEVIAMRSVASSDRIGFEVGDMLENYARGTGDGDSKDVLFIEEIQSDWHNMGSQKGYKDAQASKKHHANESRMIDLDEEITTAWDEIQKTVEQHGRQTPESMEAYRRYVRLSNEKDALEKEAGAFAKKVPDAPYKTTYTDYAMKRAIREAAENDQDYIAWTTAKQQEERWSSSYAEGYRIEYDQDMVSFANRYAKQFDPDAKVEKIVLDENGEEVWALKISDNMKKSVLEKGQARFKLSEGKDTIQVGRGSLSGRTSLQDASAEITRSMNTDGGDKAIARIHKETGWYRGENGKWQNDINIKAMKFDNGIKNNAALKSEEGGFLGEEVSGLGNLFKEFPGLEYATLRLGDTGDDVFKLDVSGKQVTGITLNKDLTIRGSSAFKAMNVDKPNSAVADALSDALQEIADRYDKGALRSFDESVPEGAGSPEAIKERAKMNRPHENRPATYTSPKNQPEAKFKLSEGEEYTKDRNGFQKKMADLGYDTSLENFGLKSTDEYFEAMKAFLKDGDVPEKFKINEPHGDDSVFKTIGDFDIAFSEVRVTDKDAYAKVKKNIQKYLDDVGLDDRSPMMKKYGFQPEGDEDDAWEVFRSILADNGDPLPKKSVVEEPKGVLDEEASIKYVAKVLDTNEKKAKRVLDLLSEYLGDESVVRGEDRLKYTKAINEFVDSAPAYALEEGKCLYRGIKVDEGAFDRIMDRLFDNDAGFVLAADKHARALNDGSPSSWSIDEKVAKDFAGWNSETDFSIVARCHNNISGTPVGNLASLQYEREILYGTHSRWTVLGFEFADDGNLYVDVIERAADAPEPKLMYRLSDLADGDETQLLGHNFKEEMSISAEEAVETLEPLVKKAFDGKLDPKELKAKINDELFDLSQPEENAVKNYFTKKYLDYDKGAERGDILEEVFGLTKRRQRGEELTPPDKVPTAKNKGASAPEPKAPAKPKKEKAAKAPKAENKAEEPAKGAEQGDVPEGGKNPTEPKSEPPAGANEEQLRPMPLNDVVDYAKRHKTADKEWFRNESAKRDIANAEEEFGGVENFADIITGYDKKGAFGKYNHTKKAEAMDMATEMLEKDGYEKTLQEYFRAVDADPYEADALKNVLIKEISRMRKAGEGDETQLLCDYFDIISKNSSMTGYASRVLNAQREFLMSTPEGRVVTVQREINKLQDRFKDRLKGEELKVDPELLKRLRNAEGSERDEILHDINLEIWSQIPATLIERINEYRHCFMLLNPKTHIRNVGGNLIFRGFRAVAYEMEVAMMKSARMQGKLAKINAKNGTEEVFNKVHVSMEDIRGSRDGSMPDNRDYLKDEFDAIYANSDSRSRYMESSRPQDVPTVHWEFGQKMIDFNYGLLEKEDLKSGLIGAFNKAYVSWCKARCPEGTALREFMEGMSEAQKKQARTYALYEGEYATFRDACALSDFLTQKKQKFAGMKGTWAWQTAGYRFLNSMLEGALPFVKTPVNIFRRSVDYSPMGLIRGVAKINKARNAEELELAIHDMCTGLTGTGIFVAGGAAAWLGGVTIQAGGISGSEFYDRDMGYQDYSLIIPTKDGDVSITLDWVAPSAMTFFTGAAAVTAIQEAVDKAKKGEVAFDEESALDLFFAMSSPLTDTSFMSSPKDTVEQFFERGMKGDAEGEFNLAGAMASLITGDVPKNYLSGLEPQLFAQMAGAFDVYNIDKDLSFAENFKNYRKEFLTGGQIQRDTRGTSDNAFLRGWQSAGRQLINKIPVARQMFLNPKLNRRGEDIKADDAITGGNIATRMLNAFFNPANMKSITKDKYDEKLIEIRNTLNPDSDDYKKYWFNFTAPPSRKLANGKMMSYDEMYGYSKSTRIEMTKDLRKMIDADNYNVMTDTMKQQEVRELYWVGVKVADYETYGANYAIKAMEKSAKETNSKSNPNLSDYKLWKEYKRVGGKDAKSFVEWRIDKERLMLRSHTTDSGDNYRLKGLVAIQRGDDALLKACDLDGTKEPDLKKYWKVVRAEAKKQGVKAKDLAFDEVSDFFCRITANLQSNKIEKYDMGIKSVAAGMSAATGNKAPERVYRGMGHNWNSAQAGGGLALKYNKIKDKDGKPKFSIQKMEQYSKDLNNILDDRPKGSECKPYVMKYIEEDLGIKDKDLAACVYQVLWAKARRDWKNPYKEKIDDHLEWGKNRDDEWSEEDDGKKKGGWGRRGRRGRRGGRGGGGGSGSGGGGEVPETATGAIKGRVTDPFGKVTNGSKDSNLDDVYRKKAKKLRESSRTTPKKK